MSRLVGGARGAGARLGLLLALAGAGEGSAQELADFDYENLAFRGLAAEVGHMWPSRVEPTSTLGVRMDLGYLGPGVRIVPGITWWSSTMKRDEVRELEARVEELIDRQNPGAPPSTVDLGTIDWSDLVLSLDGQVVWRVPLGFLTFAGVGASAHLLNGAGEAIADTFVEDLLDTVTAGGNLHAGLEYPAHEKLRLYGLGRFEVLGDLQYFELRFGAQLHLGGSEGEEPR
jgi:hypothetical protein